MRFALYDDPPEWDEKGFENVLEQAEKKLFHWM